MEEVVWDMESVVSPLILLGIITIVYTGRYDNVETIHSYMKNGLVTP